MTLHYIYLDKKMQIIDIFFAYFFSISENLQEIPSSKVLFLNVHKFSLVMFLSKIRSIWHDLKLRNYTLRG